jgi:uncharacterized protein (TIGR02246 family)
MRRMLVVGTAASLIGLAAAALGGGGTKAHAQPSDAEAVRAAASAFYAALNARDIRAMEAVWSRDADPVLIAPASRSPVVGWEAVRRSFEEAWRRFAEFSVTVREPMRVRVGREGALVVAVTPVRTKLRGGGGGNAVSYTALGTTVFERRDGRWLVVHHHASQVPR